MKISNAVIHKPWGHEYLFFENSCLSIWFLNIKKNQKTSLHCHPNKKTGLILLNGVAQISLMERSFKINAPSKIMIRNGAFHQTQACSDDICLLEVETPKIKTDLVRIKDEYGRENQGYEPQSSWTPRGKEHAFIPNKVNQSFLFNGYRFTVLPFNKENLLDKKECALVVVLNGNAFSNGTFDFCEKGEVLTIKTAKFLSSQYKINKNIKMLTIES